MLSFFRRIINSRVGVVVTLGVLVIIALAFAAGDVSGLRTSAMGSLTGNTVAKIGRDSITATELKQRVQQDMDSFRQQQPTLTMATYIAQGGFDGTLERLVTGLALTDFAGRQGMIVSKRTVDGQLASIPALQGPNGSFDMGAYQRVLAERKLTDAFVRQDIARNMLADQLTAPTVGAAQVPMQLALPYASLLLEKRAGQIGFIPVAAMPAGAAPTDAEVAAFYKRNVARYTLPERRVVRYALVSADAQAAKATPTAAEIAAAYKAAGTRFAATEKRTIDSVVAGDQQTANAIAARVKGGASIADAARAAGLEASNATVEKAAFAASSSPAIADAAFSAASGALIGPLRSPLGWTIARVAAIQPIAGKSLAQATPELTSELTRQKQAAALAAIHDAADDALSSNATFDEIVSDQKLDGRTTPALLASGADPANPAAKPDPSLTPILAAAFAAEEGDAPQLVSTGQDGSFAVVALGRIIRAAPRPLDAVKADVARDFAADRARSAARGIARTILANVEKGTSLASAMAAASPKFPPVKPLAASRAQLSADPRGATAPLALMFSMTQGSAKLIEAPQQAGWLIVKLDHIQPGNAAGNAGVVNAARTDLGRIVGREYAEQFARAVRTDIGTKVDSAAVARVRADLMGGGDTN